MSNRQTVGGEVVSLGSSDRLVSGHNGAVGVGNEGMGVSIAIGIGVSSIGGMGIGVGTGSSIRISSSIGIRISSSIGIRISSSKGIRIGTEGVFGVKVGSTGKSDCGLVSGDDGTVGVGHQVASGGHGDTGGENQ